MFLSRRGKGAVSKAVCAAAISSVALTLGGSPAIAATVTVPPVPNPLGLLDTSFITPNVALTQAQQALNALLNTAGGLTTTVQSQGTALQETLSPQISTVVSLLEAAIQQTITDATALNVAAVPEDVTDAIATLQSQLQAEIAIVEGLGLSQGLGIAQQLLSPVCSVLAVPTGVAAGLGVNLSKYNKVPTPIQAVDSITDGLVKNVYSDLYTNAFSLAAQALGPTAAILDLLKVTIDTTYYPPNGGAPVIRHTPSLLQVPTPVDIDGQTGFDACVTTSLGANNALVQQVTKMPLSKAVLPADISASLLFGLLQFTSSTKDSTLPISYTTSYSTGAKGTSLIDNTYSINRGATIDLPPNLLGGTGSLINSVLGGGSTPTPALEQIISLAGLINLSFKYVNYPSETHVTFSSGQKAAAATSTAPAKPAWPAITKYTGDARADSFKMSTDLAGLLTQSTKFTPAGGSAYLCTIGTGECANAPAAVKATQTNSFGFTASTPTHVDVVTKAAGIGSNGVDCASDILHGVIPVGDIHLTAKTLYLGVGTTTASPSTNTAWVDTDGNAVGAPITTGGASCIAAEAGYSGNIPVGFNAQDRLSNYHGSLTAGVVDSKSGTITCPAGTSVTTYTVLCSVPPANTVAPSITGQAYVGSDLTANKGTWTPGAPNAPTYSYQWQRCSASGTSCANIAGATNAVYSLPVNTSNPSASVDNGKTLRFIVTATNLDGSASATSPVSAVVTLPPPPSNTVKPTITGTLASGKALTVSTGTWINGTNGGSSSGNFLYSILACDADATSNCVPAGGVLSSSASPTAVTYTPSSSDEGRYLVAVVQATNLGGSGTGRSIGYRIVQKPVNTVVPSIKSGSHSVAGGTVQAGDHLTATSGTWTDATKPFVYSWQSCDPSLVCAAVGSGAAYTVADSDVGNTLKVVVTGSNDNIAPNNATNAETGSTLPALANNEKLRSGTQIPDGVVSASAPNAAGTGSYVGGSFDTVGAFVGNGGTVPATPTAVSNTVSQSAKVLGGKVNAVANDTLGGYFIAGSFTSVLGTPCAAIAHIKVDGTLDPTYCQTGFTGAVKAIDYVKKTLTIGTSTAVDVLVVGGDFTVNGHSNLMLLDSLGYASYSPVGDPNAAVNAIADDTAASRANFFIGGDFTSVGTVVASHLANVPITIYPASPGSDITVAPSDYPGGVSCTTASPCTVNAISVVSPSALGGYVVVGGSFDNATATSTTPSTKARKNLAAFYEAASGSQSLGTWDPSPNGVITALSTGASGTVYIAGSFTALGTTTGFNGLAEYGVTYTSLSPLDLSPKANAAGTAATSSPNTAWKPVVNTGQVLSMAIDTTGVYLAGSFTSINGTERHRLAQVTLPSATAPTLGAWNPNAGQTVRGIAKFAGLSTPSVVPASVIIGGDFQVLGGSTHNNIAEISSAANGTATSWAGSANGAISSIVVNGTGVWIGGAFTSAGGAVRGKLAALDPTTGLALGTDPNVVGTVNALASSGTGVYLGGAFSSVGGQTRSNLALVDGTGAVQGWNPGADGNVNAVAVSGATVYVGGSFANAGGSARAKIAAIDAAGTATAWNPGADGAVCAIVINGSTIYLGGNFGLVGGAAHAKVASVDVSGVVNSWDAQVAGGSVKALAFAVGKLYLGGSFTTVGGEARQSFASVSGDDASVSLFTPDPDFTVNTVSIAPSGTLTLGGAFANIGGVVSPNLAFFGA